MRVAALALALALGACCHTPPPDVVFVEKSRESLTEAPPTAPHVDPGDIVQGGACPPEFDVCLRAPANIALQRFIHDLENYGSDAWRMCGPAPSTPTSQPSTGARSMPK